MLLTEQQIANSTHTNIEVIQDDSLEEQGLYLVKVTYSYDADHENETIEFVFKPGDLDDPSDDHIVSVTGHGDSLEVGYDILNRTEVYEEIMNKIYEISLEEMIQSFRFVADDILLESGHEPTEEELISKLKSDIDWRATANKDLSPIASDYSKLSDAEKSKYIKDVIMPVYIREYDMPDRLSTTWLRFIKNLFNDETINSFHRRFFKSYKKNENVFKSVLTDILNEEDAPVIPEEEDDLFKDDSEITGEEETPLPEPEPKKEYEYTHSTIRILSMDKTKINAELKELCKTPVQAIPVTRIKEILNSCNVKISSSMEFKTLDGDMDLELSDVESGRPINNSVMVCYWHKMDGDAGYEINFYLS